MSDAMEREQREQMANEISEKTRIPIGIAVACVTGMVCGAIWLNNSLATINFRLLSIERTLNDAISSRELKLWVRQLREANPQIKIPTLDSEIR